MDMIQMKTLIFKVPMIPIMILKIILKKNLSMIKMNSMIQESALKAMNQVDYLLDIRLDHVITFPAKFGI